MPEVLFSKNLPELLDKIDFSRLGKKIAIKMHFGEEKCKTYLNPELVKILYNRLKTKDNVVELVDCNALYKGARTNATDHYKTAVSHGFTFARVKILDGELGDEYVDVNGCKLGKGIKDYDSLIVLTHFKGHATTGLGGALKNVGMGLGSRAGKLDMHATIRPQVKSSECIGCGTCVKNCPVNAITLDKTAHIDKKKCIGCATCIGVCPVGAVSIPWSSSSPERLQERICDYAKAVISIFKNVIFINCLVNITTDCDCKNKAQRPISKDLGYLYSDNIVKIDEASKELFDKTGLLTEKSACFNHFLTYAKKIGL